MYRNKKSKDEDELPKAEIWQLIKYKIDISIDSA